MEMRKLIDNRDYNGIKQAIEDNPELANEGIPYDDMNSTKAHPLHRICDGVFSKRYTDGEAVLMAKIFLENGAKVDGSSLAEKQDTPLVAAASLHADEVAILYIKNGASINHAGCHGGTALHWAAWCGRDNLVRILLKNGAEINRRCIDFEATPLFWAVHGLKKGDKNNVHNQLECARILIQSGADKDIPNKEGRKVFDLLNKEELEIVELLNR